MIREVSATFTRPADTTAYADGDLVANSTTAGSVVPLAFSVGEEGCYITRIRLEKSDTDVTAATFSIRLFLQSPTVGVGDNAAITHDVSGHIATITLGTMVSGTDDDYITLNAGDTNLGVPILVPGRQGSKIFGLVTAGAAYTPANAEVFTCYITYAKG